ncbi:MAG: hypothetical protein ABRQ39_07760 [Candidatus Eremiobacterota bacterium]
MDIVSIKDLEDCFDGSFIKELLFNEPVTKDFIYYLGKNCNLSYYANFARPFYKIESPFYVIKGVEGNVTARINLYEKNSIACLEEYIKQFKGGVSVLE